MDNSITIDNDWHPAGIRLRQLVLLGEARCHGLDVEPLMGERHLGAPAERAEAAIRLGAGQVVHRDCHELVPSYVKALGKLVEAGDSEIGGRGWHWIG
jgi:hypothetical protein